MLKLGKWLIGFVLKGGPDSIASEMRKAYEVRVSAETTQDKLDADARIAALETARVAIQAESADRWSAMRIGRLLVVIPFGLWLGAIPLVSIINPNFGTNFVVLAMPAETMQVLTWLFSVITVGSVAEVWNKRK